MSQSKITNEHFSVLLQLTSKTWRHLNYMFFAYSLVGIIGYSIYFSLVFPILHELFWLRLLAFLPFALLELTSMFSVVVLASTLSKMAQESVKEFNLVRAHYQLPIKERYMGEIRFSILYAGIFCILRLIVLIAIIFALV